MSPAPLVAAIIGGLVGLSLNALAAWLPSHGPWSAGRSDAVISRHREVALPIIAAAVGVLLWWRIGPQLSLAPASLAAALLLLIAAIDLDRRLVLNELVLVGALFALGVALSGGSSRLLSALAGGAAGLGLFLILALIQRRGMGMGDVKLAGMIGLLLGYPEVLNALLLGIVLGGFVAAGLLIARRVARRGTIAYAPFLSAGAIVTLLLR